jgi:peptidoglycan/xylan/chitin deacetylase (PgdA/CDA1 family)
MLAGGVLLGPHFSLLTGEPFDVYLTFDDGPFPDPDLKTGPTDIVLQTLKDHGAVATFFLHGRHILKWHGPVLARYIREGHALGNHLWSQGGNTIGDHPTYVRLAYQYFLTEDKIRTMMAAADPEAYQHYLAQHKLFRRPGGANHLDEFLDTNYHRELTRNGDLRMFWDDMDWLVGVYDYSGWHVNGGESLPLKIRPETPDAERQFVLHGADGYYGVYDFLSAGKPPHLSREAEQGIVILLHDADAITDNMLPQLLDDLIKLGARFRTLPRPVDRANAKTVGIGYGPTTAPLTVI